MADFLEYSMDKHIENVKVYIYIYIYIKIMSKYLYLFQFCDIYIYTPQPDAGWRGVILILITHFLSLIKFLAEFLPPTPTN